MSTLLLENPRRRRSRRHRRSRKAVGKTRRASSRRRNPTRAPKRRRGGRRFAGGNARAAVMAAVQQGGTIAGSFWLSSFVSNYLRNKFPTLGNYSASLVQAALGAALVAGRRYLPGGIGRYAPALGAGMIGSALVDWLRSSDTLSPESVAGRLVYGFPTTGAMARRGGLAEDTMLFADGDLLAPPELLGLGYDDPETNDISGLGYSAFGGRA